MNLNDSFFKKVEQKTKVNKDTILNLASKLQKGGLKDQSTIKDIIKELSSLTGKNLDPEQEEKLINTIMNDKAPKDISKFDKLV